MAVSAIFCVQCCMIVLCYCRIYKSCQKDSTLCVSGSGLMHMVSL